MGDESIHWRGSFRSKNWGKWPRKQGGGRGAISGKDGGEKQAAHERKKSEISWSFARGAIFDKKRPSAFSARGSPRAPRALVVSPLENSVAGFQKSRPRKEKLGGWKWAMRAFTGGRPKEQELGKMA